MVIHNYDYGIAGVLIVKVMLITIIKLTLKSVKENAEKQGLFDVTLDVKGNDINPPRDIDLVFVIDFSSTMSGEKTPKYTKCSASIFNQYC